MAFLKGVDTSSLDAMLWQRFLDIYDFSNEQLRESSSAKDAAVILRQLIRHVSEIRYTDTDPLFRPTSVSVPRWICESLGSSALRSAGIDIVAGDPNSEWDELRASPWSPAWLESHQTGRVDRASVGNVSNGFRGGRLRVPADEPFRRATRRDTYTGPGQRAAVRAALTIPAGDVLMCCLPTGSGKTEVAFALAAQEIHKTMVIVIPTTSLAMDLERRIRDHQYNGSSEAPVAWIGDTSVEDREKIREALAHDNLPFLVTTPESLTSTLRAAFLNAARAGRIGSLVVDEAHIVSQWGKQFRPDFEEVAAIAREAVEACREVGAAPMKTLLLSATLGPEEVEHLSSLFDYGGSSKISIVAANRLRSEIDMFCADAVPSEDRKDRVMEALHRLPRPLILYVTQPRQAREWMGHLREDGFQRIAEVTGETPASQRQSVLAGMRASADGRSLIDVVVATSAFGLGIDNDQVRSVVHACLPETVDRWYQEIGRAGRDGHAAVALLLPSSGSDGGRGDKGIAAGNRARFLSSEIAERRWQSMWTGRTTRDRDGMNFVNLQARSFDVESGSYNYKWNSQLLHRLEALGVLRSRRLSFSEAFREGLSDIDSREKSSDGRFDAVVDVWAEIELVGHELRDAGPHFWKRFEQFADEDRAIEQRSFELTERLFNGETNICGLLRSEYEPDENVKNRFGNGASSGMMLNAYCGRCTKCRQEQRLPEDPMVFGPWRWRTDYRMPDRLRNVFDSLGVPNRTLHLYADDPRGDAKSFAQFLRDENLISYFVGFESGTIEGDCFIDEPKENGHAILPISLAPLPFLAVVHGQIETWAYEGWRSIGTDGKVLPAITVSRASDVMGESMRYYPLEVVRRMLANV
ncbi:MAG: protein DpdF [Actinomycetota bacterium]|nr:protein DpdF [Actinomycetota bacterium]